MPKLNHKALKTKKLKSKTTKSAFHKQSPLRRRLLAGAVIAVILAPASWMAVNAQSSEAALVGAGTTVSGHVDSAVAREQSGHSAGAASTSNAGGKATSTTTSSSTKKSSSTTSTSKQSSAANKPNTTKPAPAPIPVPAPQAVVAAFNGVHDNIITTIFWAGETADASNAHISNAESAWDGNWQVHFGGFDDPSQRNGYNPAGFTPLENPFYFALPYNDLDSNGNRKASATNCSALTGGSSPISWCKNAWIKITKAGKTAYAQWQDVGPLQEDDSAYVFGSAGPKNTWGAHAGLDVSPAVRDYLGLQDVDSTSWSFVQAGSVPAGPWKNIVTTSNGGW